MFEYFAGIDWGSETHQVCVVDSAGGVSAERAFSHGGAGLAEMAAWILARAGVDPHAVGVTIEIPHGPVVETMMERGFTIHSVNPKQLDRFRDRFSPAGAKDDRRNARVLADALRTDGHAFRRLDPAAPEIVELREWSRIAEAAAIRGCFGVRFDRNCNCLSAAQPNIGIPYGSAPLPWKIPGCFWPPGQRK